MLMGCGPKGPLIEYCVVHLYKEVVNGEEKLIDVKFACHTKTGEDVLRGLKEVENYVCTPPEDIATLLKECTR